MYPPRLCRAVVKGGIEELKSSLVVLVGEDGEDKGEGDAEGLEEAVDREREEEDERLRV